MREEEDIFDAPVVRTKIGPAIELLDPPLDDPRFSVIDESADVIDINSRRSKPVYHNNSYLSAVQIFEEEAARGIYARGLLENKSLAYNEMTGIQEIGGEPIIDEDITRFRSDIERDFPGGIDKNGLPRGLRLSAKDIGDAVNQVARKNTHHPVREYLKSLTWDGVSRLDSVCDEILGATRTELNIAMTRRFFIGAVARVFDPGCKLDTMLILIGKQGARKSSFFNILGGKWFLDSPIDIRNKDAYQTLRTAWIAEWAELESISRAREIDTVKAFLAASKDDYRPSYGKRSITVKRSSAIVGTTNRDEFLIDETGNRRFWTMRIGAIDIQTLIRQRDQLWAEACTLYHAGDKCADCRASWKKHCDAHAWWLSDAEQSLLDANQKQHMVCDVWDGTVLMWINEPTMRRDTRYAANAIENPIEPFARAPTTGDVIMGALHKPLHQWTHLDEIRVSRILQRFGYERTTDPKNVSNKIWRKKS